MPVRLDWTDAQDRTFDECEIRVPVRLLWNDDQLSAWLHAHVPNPCVGYCVDHPWLRLNRGVIHDNRGA